MAILFLIPETCLFLFALVLLVPIAFLLFQVLAAANPSDLPMASSRATPRTCIVIPAHNEAAGIAVTLEAVLDLKSAACDILVVADNCTDSTAEIARRYGVAVIERTDTEHVGKSYALAFGFAHLEQNPPQVVVVLDADSVPAPGAVTRLVHRAVETMRPVQAAYRWRTVTVPSPLQTLSNFAFLIKNVVRPLGLFRLHAPCLLNGSGMAFPWAALASAACTNGHLVEDMWSSIELTCAGYAPVFCPQAMVYSNPPRRSEAVLTQRTRWERGHLATMLNGIPRLVLAAVRQGRTDPLWLAFELSVPPLALLVFGVTVLCLLSLVASLVESGSGSSPVMWLIAPADLVLLGAAVLIAWWKFGRAELSGRVLLAAPAYVVWKIPMYFRMLLERRPMWTRTERDPVTFSGEGKA